MLKKSLLILSVIFVAVLIGCNKTETGNSNMTAENSNKAKTTATTATTKASTGEKIGVPECDDYIAKYEACTPKVPEAARAQYKAALDSARASWKKLAENPTTKGSLAAACKQAMQMQESTWKTYGCAQ